MMPSGTEFKLGSVGDPKNALKKKSEEISGWTLLRRYPDAHKLGSHPKNRLRSLLRSIRHGN